jgi:hypothetical protein
MNTGLGLKKQRERGEKHINPQHARTKEVLETRKFGYKGEQLREEGTIAEHNISQPREWTADHGIDGLMVYK